MTHTQGKKAAKSSWAGPNVGLAGKTSAPPPWVHTKNSSEPLLNTGKYGNDSEITALRIKTYIKEKPGREIVELKSTITETETPLQHTTAAGLRQQSREAAP